MPASRKQPETGPITALFALLIMGAAGPHMACSRGGAADADDGNTVYLLDYQTALPTSWESREPSSSMRLAEFRTPGTDSSAGAEVVVFFFGQGQGGSVEANIGRWQSQFLSDEGGPVAPRITRDLGGALRTTVAEFTGTYARSVGVGMHPDSARADQGLVAAIVETPEGNLFIQLFGPSAIVAAERDAFLSFVSGLEPRLAGS